MKFSIKDFFSKCDQIRRKLRIWSHLLKKSLMENFIFCPLWCNHSERNDLLVLFGRIVFPLGIYLVFAVVSNFQQIH